LVGWFSFHLSDSTEYGDGVNDAVDGLNLVGLDLVVRRELEGSLLIVRRDLDDIGWEDRSPQVQSVQEAKVPTLSRLRLAGIAFGTRNLSENSGGARWAAGQGRGRDGATESAVHTLLEVSRLT
jgi:hypothetical protein